MRTAGRLHRLIACVLLATTTLTACTSWHVQTVSPEQVVNTEHPKAVRVQRMDGSRVVLKSPRISSDSLLGTAIGQPTGMPLSDVYQLAVKRGSTGKTIALVVGVAAVAFLALAAAYVITCADSYCGQ
jgi:hypothetical protein